MSTVDEHSTAPSSTAPPPAASSSTATSTQPPQPVARDVAVSLARRSWRQLTSMRTALVLLFLLAVAAIPGSLLPQRRVDNGKVTGYFAANPSLAPWLDRFGLFDVYASPWFSAIYLLLFASLVGCLLPRLRTHVEALLRVPPDAPARLERLPAYAAGLDAGADSGADADAGADADDAGATVGHLRALLRRRRFRVAVREHPDGSTTVSAEKGYLKETGNLLFHFALLGLIVGVALGSLYGWHGNRLLVAGEDGRFCNTVQQYDEHGLGTRVSGAELPRFCLRLDDFTATYLENGQPLTFDAELAYRTAGGPERVRHVTVNEPLRLDGANVYLFGHGYATVIRYTDRFGRVQTTVAPFLPSDGVLTSEGVALFPDANVDPATGRRDGRGQIGFAGVYLPTVPDDPAHGRSLHPEERDPRLMLVAYQGDLGLDAGTPLSVYALDQRQLDAGRLKQLDEPHMLRVGESWTLSDGSRVEFLGTRDWVTLSVRHDPGEPIVLAGAVLLIVGLLASLAGRRRRIWFRLDAAGGLAAGGLPRGEYLGFHAEFDAIVRDAIVRDAIVRDAIVRDARKEGA